jgi:hypothetical protein
MPIASDVPRPVDAIAPSASISIFPETALSITNPILPTTTALILLQFLRILRVTVLTSSYSG